MSQAPRKPSETKDPGSIEHVEHWVFDLDNTLYPSETGVFMQVSERITRFVARALALDHADAEQVRRDYFRTHGSTLLGLMTHHATDPEDYLSFVHDIDLEMMQSNPELDAALGRLSGRKVIFTSANRNHTERVLARLGIRHHFELLFSIENSDYLPKPHSAIYLQMTAECGVEPSRAAMFDDSARNLIPASEIGMVTVWVPNESDFSHHGADLKHIDFVVDDLAAWLDHAAQLRGEPTPSG